MTDSREEQQNRQLLRGEGSSHTNMPLAPVYIRASDANSVIPSLNGVVESANDVFTGVPQEVLDRDTRRMKYADALFHEQEREREKQESDDKENSETPNDTKKGCAHGGGIVIPGLQIDTEDDDRLCEVCQCGYEDEEEVMILPCQHFFHSKCVGRWLNMKTTCPKCRYELSPPAPTEQREVIITRTTTIEWMPITQWVPASTITVEVRSEVGSDYETVTTTTTRPVMIQGTNSLPQPPNGMNHPAPGSVNARAVPFSNTAPNNGHTNLNSINNQNPHNSNALRPATINPTNSSNSGNIPVLTAVEYQRLLERANEALQQVQAESSDPSQAPQPTTAARIPVLTEEEYRRLMERAHEALQQRNEDGPDLPRTNLSAGPGQTSSSAGPQSQNSTSHFNVLSQDYQRMVDRTVEPLPSSQAGPLNGTAWNAQNASVGLPQMAWNTSSPPTSLPASTPHRSNSIQSNAVLPIYGSPEWSSSSLPFSSSAWHVLENMSPPTGPHPRILTSALNPNMPAVDSGSPTLQPIAAMGAVPVTPPLLPGSSRASGRPS